MTRADSFITANRQRIEGAGFDRAALIDHVLDSIRYQGGKRRAYIERLKRLTPAELAAVVFRYWQRGLIPLPAGWVPDSTEMAEARAESGPPAPVDDLRNYARRVMASFDAAGQLVTRDVTTPALDTFHAQQVKCASSRGCVGCKRLNSKTGFCRKWNRYITANLTEMAAAF